MKNRAAGSRGGGGVQPRGAIVILGSLQQLSDEDFLLHAGIPDFRVMSTATGTAIDAIRVHTFGSAGNLELGDLDGRLAKGAIGAVHGAMVEQLVAGDPHLAFLVVKVAVAGIGDGR